VREECVADQAELLCFFFGDVHRRDERSAFLGEHGLRGFGIAKLATTVRVAARFDHATRGEYAIEAMLGIGGERAREGAELGDDIVAVNFPPPSGQVDYAAIAASWLLSSNPMGHS
jgi:hypothetical protein